VGLGVRGALGAPAAGARRRLTPHDHPGAHAATFTYEPHDLLLLDNLAVAHRAAPGAHDAAPEAGLRVLHRTTVRGVTPVDPPPASGLPTFAYIWGPSQLSSGVLGEAPGVWQGSDHWGVGFRWNASLPMRN
jgi:taurine dioxygenase